MGWGLRVGCSAPACLRRSAGFEEHISFSSEHFLPLHQKTCAPGSLLPHPQGQVLGRYSS